MLEKGRTQQVSHSIESPNEKALSSEPVTTTLNLGFVCWVPMRWAEMLARKGLSKPEGALAGASSGLGKPLQANRLA
jgi:hypothetical protein